MSATKELLEMRLKRYLHYGSELPIYKSGDRFFQNAYSKESVPSLLKLIEEEPKSVIQIIRKVSEEETSLWPDALIFALAMCIQQGGIELQTEAYQSIRDICKTGREMLLFVKFWRQIKGKTGGGSGFKRAIAQWYLIKAPFDLADIFLEQKSYFGWTHSDVLSVCHAKPVTAEQKVLFSYVRRGIKDTANRYGENANETVTELLEYISTVESFRKIKEENDCAKALTLELHGIERVPKKFHNSQKVWNELIPNMNIDTLLHNFQRISSKCFLRNNNDTVMKVKDVFNNARNAETFKHHPTKVLITLMTYDKAAEYRLNLGMKKNHPVSKQTPVKKPPKRNMVIRNALTTFFYSLYQFQKPTKLRYLVAVDLRRRMHSDRCFHCVHMSPVEAAQAICLSLVRTEPAGNVKIGTFVDPTGTLEEVKCDKEWTLNSFETSFKELSGRAGAANVAGAIHWADTKNWPIDVFVVLSNFALNTKGSRPAITKYRTDKDLPNCKLITCSLNGTLRSHKDVEGLNMQCVIGFDEHICRLIEVFARGAF